MSTDLHTLADLVAKAEHLRGKCDPKSLASTLRLWGLDDLSAAADLLDVLVPWWTIWKATEPPCKTCTNGWVVVGTRPTSVAPCSDCGHSGVRSFIDWFGDR